MTQFDKHVDDPIQQKIDQIKHIHRIGTTLNADKNGAWRVTMDIANLGATMTFCLFRRSDTMGQAILQTTVNIRPEHPLSTEIEHESFQANLREHLNGLIALIHDLTGIKVPEPDAVTQQNNLIGVINP